VNSELPRRPPQGHVADCRDSGGDGGAGCLCATLASAAVQGQIQNPLRAAESCTFERAETAGTCRRRHLVQICDGAECAGALFRPFFRAPANTSSRRRRRASQHPPIPIVRFLALDLATISLKSVCGSAQRPQSSRRPRQEGGLNHPAPSSPFSFFLSDEAAAGLGVLGGRVQRADRQHRHYGVGEEPLGVPGQVWVRHRERLDGARSGHPQTEP